MVHHVLSAQEILAHDFHRVKDPCVFLSGEIHFAVRVGKQTVPIHGRDKRSEIMIVSTDWDEGPTPPPNVYPALYNVPKCPAADGLDNDEVLKSHDLGHRRRRRRLRCILVTMSSRAAAANSARGGPDAGWRGGVHQLVGQQATITPSFCKKNWDIGRTPSQRSELQTSSRWDLLGEIFLPRV